MVVAVWETGTISDWVCHTPSLSFLFLLLVESHMLSPCDKARTVTEWSLLIQCLPQSQAGIRDNSLDCPVDRLADKWVLVTLLYCDANLLQPMACHTTFTTNDTLEIMTVTCDINSQYALVVLCVCQMMRCCFCWPSQTCFSTFQFVC